MIKYSPFYGLSAPETAEIRRCLCPVEKIYRKGDIIMQFSENNDILGLVDSGIAYLVRIDINGNRSIIDYYESGDVFGKLLSPESHYDAYYVMSKEKCRVSFIDYNKLLSKCSNNCLKHTTLLNNLLMITLRKTQMHIDVLSQRSTKQKLITFFDYQCTKNSSASFTIPLSLSDLSEYLSVDRSAMMRELKLLKENNIISADGNSFTLKINRYT